MYKLRKKGGELTTNYVIGLLVTVIAFALIVYGVFYTLNLRDISKDQVCKLSVNARATSFEATQNFIPLNCNTEKICLGDDCEDAFAGEKYNTINLDDSIAK